MKSNKFANLVLTNPRLAGVLGIGLGLALLALNHYCLTSSSDGKYSPFLLIFSPAIVLWSFVMTLFPGLLYSGAVRPDGRPVVNTIPGAIIGAIGLLIAWFMAHKLYGLF